jgi:hypothetical protein
MGSWGKRGTTGAAAGLDVPEFLRGFPGGGITASSYDTIPTVFGKKTHMKSKTSHPSNENFTLQTQFPFARSIVRIIQNFHDKKDFSKALFCNRIPVLKLQP